MSVFKNINDNLPYHDASALWHLKNVPSYYIVKLYGYCVTILKRCQKDRDVDDCSEGKVSSTQIITIADAMSKTLPQPNFMGFTAVRFGIRATTHFDNY